MISVDTNVIFSALNTEDRNHVPARQALSGLPTVRMLISPPVYTELRAHTHWAAIESWLEASAIQTEWDMPPAVWERAGIALREYTELSCAETGCVRAASPPTS